MPVRASLLCFLALSASLMIAPPAVADHEYYMPVWFKWYEFDLEVYVLGIDDPIIGRATKDAIESWNEGIQQLAPPWLRDNLSLLVWNPADDPVPPPDYQATNIDILVVPYGNSAQITSARCIARAPNPAWGSSTYYEVIAHEFGHCLGLGHIFNHGNEYYPGFDIMGIAGNGHPCPSNLNLMVMERVFGHLVGSPSGGSVTIPASQYYQASC